MAGWLGALLQHAARRSSEVDWCAASGGIHCTSELGWRFFTACGLERNVHWWRYDFEALALPSLTALGANARHILVLGGVSGGGVINSFLQSSDVEEVLWVSEMKSVIKAAARCVPSLSWLARPEPRLRVVHLDTQEFLRSAAVNAGYFDIVVQDTLSLYRDEKRERSHWSDVTEDYFAAWRLEVIQQLLSPRGLLVATAGYLTTPRSLRVAYDALAPYFKLRQPLQFAAPDTAHATGVTIAFIAGGDEGTTQMNQSWWRAQSIETCFYTEEMHAALLAPSKTLMKILGLGSAPPNVNDLPRRTCAYEDAWNKEGLLFARQSKFQKLQVKNEKPSEDSSGCTALFLDDELQETDVYGDFYHEAMVHVAMAQLGPNAQRVLLLGGGDGGAASLALKYPEVEVLQVEIDEMVIETSQRFFQNFSSAFGHPRHKLIVADAVRWVEQNWREMQQTFDLCIIDSTDEPLASVWSGKFYKHLKSMLKAHGAVVQNVGNQLDTLAEFRAWHLPLFRQRRLINCLTPDYESPYFLAFLADVEINPVNWTWWTSLNISTIYYHPGLHDALLAIPKETIDSYVDGKEWVPHDAVYSKQHFGAAVSQSRSPRSGEL